MFDMKFIGFIVYVIKLFYGFVILSVGVNFFNCFKNGCFKVIG